MDVRDRFRRGIGPSLPSETGASTVRRLFVRRDVFSLARAVVSFSETFTVRAKSIAYGNGGVFSPLSAWGGSQHCWLFRTVWTVECNTLVMAMISTFFFLFCLTLYTLMLMLMLIASACVYTNRESNEAIPLLLQWWTSHLCHITLSYHAPSTGGLLTAY